MASCRGSPVSYLQAFPLPVVGNLFQLSNGIFHATLAKLSHKYGPLMTIKQGRKTVIVASSPRFAKELLKNPEKMKKARAEIREVIGQSKAIQESDISSLPDLQAVVKETFRLHPAATINGRQPDANIEIDKYIIPKDSQIFGNIWAIGKDPGMWWNANSFVPERFLDSEIDVKGHHFGLLPFGTGRRICPGMPLAHRMMHLMLASFLQKYDWKLEEGMHPENMGMNETFGLTVRKAIPLKAIPIRTTS